MAFIIVFFQELGVDIPAATHCDPACAVLLPGETEPISVWRDPDQWRAERERQFPGSDGFWRLLANLFQYNWGFQSRDPVIPPRNAWDGWQLLQAVRPDTLLTVPHLFTTVGQLLRLTGLGNQRRLKTFLDLQLKLYSQVNADQTALLYAATALGVSQAPQGLFHLQGSMQVLSDRIVDALKQHGGELHMGHSVDEIQVRDQRISGIRIRQQKTGKVLDGNSRPCGGQCHGAKLWCGLLGENAPRRYEQRVKKLPPSSGAFVIYLGVDAAAIPENCPPHLQFLYDYDGPIGENNSLFVSVSRPGDGRAPEGKATIIASSFTDPKLWEDTEDYEGLKQRYVGDAIAHLNQYFHLTPDTIVHQEAATPRTFAHFTGRSQGIVGGIGQRLSTFGPFGFATRTPIKRLWLVGDSTHPGEGTAGVSYSALTAVNQLLAMDH